MDDVCVGVKPTDGSWDGVLTCVPLCVRICDAEEVTVAVMVEVCVGVEPTGGREGVNESDIDSVCVRV